MPLVVWVGLPSRLLLAMCTNIGAVRRTTFGSFRKRTKEVIRTNTSGISKTVSTLVRITFWFVPNVISTQSKRGLRAVTNLGPVYMETSFPARRVSRSTHVNTNSRVSRLSGTKGEYKFLADCITASKNTLLSSKSVLDSRKSLLKPF